MANLPESATWETGIYQLEETDPVQGGPNGIDNQQGKQLANRTAWLKTQVEMLGTGKQPLDTTLTALAELSGIADRLIYFTGPDAVALTPLSAFIRSLLDDANASAARTTLGAISQAQLDAAIAALVNSSPATLDTLNELAAALGNDANFATTISNAMALKASILSVQKSESIVSAAGGTADAITGSYTPGITALTNGMTLYVRTGSANATTTPTFTPNSGTIAAKTIVKGNGLALVAGDIAGGGHWIELQYDSTLDKWVLLNPFVKTPPGKNLLINGNFDVWQRGGTPSVAAGGVQYTADQWALSSSVSSAGPVLTVTRQQFTAGQTSVPNEPTYYARITSATVANLTGLVFQQRIEGVRASAGKTLSISFYAQSSTGAEIAVSFAQNFGTGGSPSAKVSQTVASGVALTGAMKKFSYNMTIPSISGKTLGTNGDDNLEIAFSLPINAAHTVDIAQVQVEISPVATDFEIRQPAYEKLLCQRHYMRWDQQDNFLGGASTTGTNSRAWANFPVQMRAAPTGNMSGVGAFTVNDNSASQTSTAVTFTQTTKNGARIDVTHAALGTQKPVFYQLNASNWIDFSAEL